MYTDPMDEIEIPKGIEARIEEDRLTIKGKFGSTSKRINGRLLRVSVDSNKVLVKEAENRKLARIAVLAAQAFGSEIRSAIKGASEGIEKKMVVFYAHFPMTIEVNEKQVFIKNIFGEKVPRVAGIVGDTKVEVKDQELIIKGADPYDVGQTIANLRKVCYSRGYDTRVFQDGVYLSREE